MSSLGAPQQHKQPSRKGKKAWRKNVDVSEVQEGLEHLRDEIRSGGPISEKKSEDLFALDTIGSQEITKKYDLRKPLKADEILAQRSAVPAVDSRKRPSSALPSGIYEPSNKRKKNDWVSKKEVQRIRNTINNSSHLDGAVPEGEQTSNFDLWSSEPGLQSMINHLEYIPRVKPTTKPDSMKLGPIAMTVSGKPVPAVRNPDAGISYNPSFEDWDELLRKEGDKEVKAEKLRIQAEAAEAERQARIQAAGIDDDVAGRTDDESAWEGFETENEDLATLRKKRPRRKTPTERNKAIRKKNAESLAKHQNRMGDRKKWAQESEDVGKQAAVVQSSRTSEIAEIVPDEQDFDDSTLRRRKMGNTSIPEKNLELVLPDELQDSLRLLKPEGNLLQDRFRNLLVNGRIESRKPVLHAKKKRVKYTEKWSHKDFEVQV